MNELPFETTVSVRYQDMDALGHVNNAVYATYLEQARIEFFSEKLDLTKADISTVVAHLELDFHAPIVDSDSVTIGVAPTDIGEKSFTLTYEIEDESRIVSQGETVQVWMGDDGRSAELPTNVREVLTAYLEEP